MEMAQSIKGKVAFGLVLALCGVPAAQAQPIAGLYIGAGATANFRVDTFSNAVSPRTGASTTRLDVHTGQSGLAALGWGFGNGLRVELEGSYRTNNVAAVYTVNGINGGVRATDSPSGRVSIAGAMANLVYDLDLRRYDIQARPYVGVGIGFGWLQFANVGGNETFALNTSAGTVTGSGRGIISDTVGGLIYQAIVGSSFPIPEVPGLEALVEYRYVGMPALDMVQTIKGTVSGTGQPFIGQRVQSFTSSNHVILVGLRYALNKAPPAPVAAPEAPAPSPTRTFLVFFDWDRAELTDRARQIIGEAAASARTANVTRIEVQGHADRSGDAAYNMRLSQRRADAVATELVHRGVARTAITTQAFGETRPLIPTADGVREPQNRRVEIILR
jgi:outer membrane protein OmpA-like peptidoglycan-associated protein